MSFKVENINMPKRVQFFHESSVKQFRSLPEKCSQRHHKTFPIALIIKCMESTSNFCTLNGFITNSHTHNIRYIETFSYIEKNTHIFGLFICFYNVVCRFECDCEYVTPGRHYRCRVLLLIKRKSTIYGQLDVVIECRVYTDFIRVINIKRPIQNAAKKFSIFYSAHR